jgi:hypothetical protein
METMLTNLEFEHALRAFVQKQRERLEALDADMDEYNVTWDIDFDPSRTKGAWRVAGYRYDVTISGAQLADVVDIIIEQVRKTRGKNILPALIEHAPLISVE